MVVSETFSQSFSRGRLQHSKYMSWDFPELFLRTSTRITSTALEWHIAYLTSRNTWHLSGIIVMRYSERTQLFKEQNVRPDRIKNRRSISVTTQDVGLQGRSFSFTEWNCRGMFHTWSSLSFRSYNFPDIDYFRRSSMKKSDHNCKSRIVAL